MAITNLRASLTRTYENWLGEQKTLQEEIDKIRKAYEGLNDKEVRLGKVEQLLECSEIILKEIHPEFDPKKVRPKRKNTSILPFATGDITRWTFDILRDSTEPLRSREIAERIIKQHKLDPDDAHLLSRITSSIDGSLRGKIGKHVEKIGKWPIRWRVIEHPTKPPFGR